MSVAKRDNAENSANDSFGFSSGAAIAEAAVQLPGAGRRGNPKTGGDACAGGSGHRRPGRRRVALPQDWPLAHQRPVCSGQV